MRATHRAKYRLKLRHVCSPRKMVWPSLWGRQRTDLIHDYVQTSQDTSIPCDRRTNKDDVVSRSPLHFVFFTYGMYFLHEAIIKPQVRAIEV